MPGISILREHSLGLADARRIADDWVRQAEQDYAMSCEIVRGDAGDTVRFRRSGVDGELLVRADRFELSAQLGFLLGAFSHRIEREIGRNLDVLLSAAEQGRQAPAPQIAHGVPAKRVAKSLKPVAGKSRGVSQRGAAGKPR